MTLQQLQTFCMVVEQSSFVKAAECLYMAQSSVSQQVAALERHFGVTLFCHRGKKSILTPAGRVLFDVAKQILALVESAPVKIRETQTLSQGLLRLGASSTVSTYLLPVIVRKYRELYPDIHLSIRAGYGHDMVDMVRDRNLDLALVGHNLNWLADRTLKSQPFGKDHLSLIVWPGHEWCGRKMIEPKEMSGKYNFIHARPDSAMRSVVEKFLHQENLSFHSVIEMANHESIKRAVEAQIGISLISSVAIKDELRAGRLAEIPLNRLNLVDRNFLLVARGDQEFNLPELAFIDMVKSMDKIDNV